MRLLCVLILCSLAIAPAFAETNALPTEITVDGVTYSNVTFGTRSPAWVNVRHSAGIAKIPLAKLPAELQQQLGYEPQKAEQHRQAETQQAELGEQQRVGQITDSELDALEKHFQTDPQYHWKILQGDRKRTIALILAAQKRKPASAQFWAAGLGMMFARDRGEARELPDKERRERYCDALGYLQEFSQSVESAIKANPDKPALMIVADLLNGSVALAAFESGELDIAKRLGEEMLKNNTDTKSWNYGNVIYDANTLLGRVALRKGDLKAAKMYLLESGKTPGSPQLNSFGPSFVLDRELLEKGEKAVVLEHLELVSKFWGNTNRNYGGRPRDSAANGQRVDAGIASKLAQWKKEIEEGCLPSDPQWK